MPLYDSHRFAFRTRPTWLGILMALALAMPGVAAKRAPDVAPASPGCPSPAAGLRSPKPTGVDSDATSAKGETPDVLTQNSVIVGGRTIDYCAVAGSLVVHPKGWDDSASRGNGEDHSDEASRPPTPAEASMFYVAYLKRGVESAARPITFLFNGGPGSATIWLHMGAFGPRRVETADARHSTPAPYRLVNNDQSLLDVSDLVFIDAPGTGFSRVYGQDKEKSFYGVDEDAYAFARFVTEFLSKYGRWNAPRYLFGESYGTMRAVVLANMLQDDPAVEFNGIVLLSQMLVTSLYTDQPKATPGNDLPFQVGLPTFAATAWYHSQQPDQRSANVPRTLLADVERFAMGDYAAALAAGASLSEATRATIVARLHEYTGLSPDYLTRADLRVGADEFRQELLHDKGLIIGATDTRFSGHTLDRLSRRANYDPSDTAIGSAYVSTFNDYVRRVLGYGQGKTYRPMVDEIGDKWNFSHQIPDFSDAGASADQATNVLPDLARAMKTNPLLKVQVNAGYYDLLTPYFEAKYEMRHLPIPPELRANIEYHCYASGHMVYLSPDILAQLHDSVADFIGRTSNLGQPATANGRAAARCASDD